MATLLSSPARLADPEALGLLVAHVSRHLGRRYAERAATYGRVLDEEERLRIVPLLFGLLPRSAIFRPRYDIAVKPLILAHLSKLGVEPTPMLIDVLKSVADQYYRTAPGASRPRKWGIADLKASDPKLYRELLAQQAGRCSYCGLEFDGNVEESLDHIIPWRLVGDVGDGTNWQILCRPCNAGKSSFISTLQAEEAQNWIYDRGLAEDMADASLRTRFLVLVQQPNCSHPECCQSARTSRLHVVPRMPDALPIADHLRVLCELHRSS